MTQYLVTWAPSGAVLVEAKTARQAKSKARRACFPRLSAPEMKARVALPRELPNARRNHPSMRGGEQLTLI